MCFFPLLKSCCPRVLPEGFLCQEMVRAPVWVRLEDDMHQAFVLTVPLAQKAMHHGPTTKDLLNKKTDLLRENQTVCSIT